MRYGFTAPKVYEIGPTSGYIWGQTWKHMGVWWNVLGFWVGGYGTAVDVFGLCRVTRGGCFWALGRRYQRWMILGDFSDAKGGWFWYMCVLLTLVGKWESFEEMRPLDPQVDDFGELLRSPAGFLFSGLPT